jgi:ATP-dependent protease ClpP protease subunit
MPDWGQVFNEINQRKASKTQEAIQAVDWVRRHYLRELFEYTGRNIIAYYSGWLSKPDIAQTEIVDEDKNGFMMACHKINKNAGLDLIIHSPGGDIAATQSIVDYLHQMFGNNIRAIVPQIAMSAGTMIACSCREILMGKHSNLGPTDPHLYGVPAYGAIKEFRQACREVKADPSKAPIWQAIIGQYRPTFLRQCKYAIDWSNSFVMRELETVMFEKDSNSKIKAKDIVRKLTDYRGNKTHNRHIYFDELHKMGLNVTLIEGDPKLQDLVLTAHHCYMHSLMNTPSFKMIENHLGSALVKQQQIVMVR